MSTQQTHKRNYMHTFFNNKTNNNMFPTETLSFQASQPIRSSKDILVSTDTIKHFLGKIEERYSFRRKPESQQENKTSPE